MFPLFPSGRHLHRPRFFAESSECRMALESKLVKTPFIVRYPAPCAVPSRRLSDPDLRRRGSQPLIEAMELQSTLRILRGNESQRASYTGYQKDARPESKSESLN